MRGSDEEEAALDEGTKVFEVEAVDTIPMDHDGAVEEPGEEDASVRRGGVGGMRWDEGARVVFGSIQGGEICGGRAGGVKWRPEG